MWNGYSIRDKMNWHDWLYAILDCKEKDIARLLAMMGVTSVDVTYEWMQPTKVVVYNGKISTTWHEIDGGWENVGHHWFV